MKGHTFCVLFFCSLIPIYYGFPVTWFSTGSTCSPTLSQKIMGVKVSDGSSAVTFTLSSLSTSQAVTSYTPGQNYSVALKFSSSHYVLAASLGEMTTTTPAKMLTDVVVPDPSAGELPKCTNPDGVIGAANKLQTYTLLWLSPSKVGSGTVTFTVTIASGFGAAVLQKNITFTEATAAPTLQSQIMSFPTIPQHFMGDQPFQLAAGASSGLPVTFNSSNPSIISISGNIATINGIGSAIIMASQLGSSTFAPVSMAQSVAIAAAPLKSQTITFGPLSPRFFGDAPFTLAATASSGLPVTYLTSDSSIVTISGNQVTIEGAGTVTITASQAGDSTWSPATATQALTIQEISPQTADQDISFLPLDSHVFGSAPFALTASSSSGLPIEFSSSNTQVATITSNIVTILAAGTTTITAHQSGNTDFAPASVSHLLTITSVPQIITFSALTPAVLGSATTITLTGSTDSGLPLSYESSNATVASVQSNILTIKSKGSTDIIASQPGNQNISPAQPVTQTLVVAGKPQTISFPPIQPVTFGQVVQTTTMATISSGLSIIFSSSNPAIANIVGNTIALLGVGQVTIIASQPGDNFFAAAQNVSQGLTISAGSQTISLRSFDIHTAADGTLDLPGVSSANLPISYSSSNPTVATIAGNKLQIGLPGNTVITAAQAGNSLWQPAPSVSQTLIVTIAQQQINWPSLPESTYGDAPIKLSAVATSNAPVNYSSSNPSVATISGNFLTIVGAGISLITAIQAGNVAYASVNMSQPLVVYPQPQTIEFAPLPSVKQGSVSQLTLSASTSSGLPIIFQSSNDSVASIDGNNTVLIHGIGKAVILAIQNGDANHLPAPSVVQMVNVYDSSLILQVIDFEPLDPVDFGASPLTLSASVSPSDLPVTFYIDNNQVASITGNIVTIVGAGDAVITAIQTGNEIYAPASPVARHLTVNQAKQTITFTAPTAIYFADPPITLTAVSNSGLHVVIESSDPSILSLSTDNQIIVKNVGSVTLKASQDGDENWLPAQSITQVITINPTPQTITFFPIPSLTYGDSSLNVLAKSDMNSTISYKSSNPNVCTMDDNTLIINGAGTAIITAYNEGNAYLGPAAATQPVTIGRAGQIINNFPPINPVHFQLGMTFSLRVSSTSGLWVTLSSSDYTVANVMADTVITIGGAGTCNIIANQAGNANYLPAGVVMQQLVVLPLNQSISFDPIPEHSLPDLDFMLTATSDADLPVTLVSSDPNVAIVLENNIVSITGQGSAIITAMQNGGQNYGPAPNVSQTLLVGPTDSISDLESDAVRVAMRMVSSPQQQATISPFMSDFKSNVTQLLLDSVDGLTVDQIQVEAVYRSGDATGIVIFADILPPDSAEMALSLVEAYNADSSNFQQQAEILNWDITGVSIYELGSSVVLPGPDDNTSHVTPTQLPQVNNSAPSVELLFKGKIIKFAFAASLSKGFTIYWKWVNQQITIAVSSPVDSDGGWVGFGFSKGGDTPMIGSHAIAAWGSDSTSGVREFYLGGQTPSAVVTENVQNVTNMDVEFRNDTGTVTFIFTRPLAVQGAGMIDLIEGSPVVWAKGDMPSTPNTLNMHTDYDYGKIYFGTGAVEGSTVSPIKKVHAVLMSLGWGFFIPVGILVARYGKEFRPPLWFQLHQTFQVLGLVTSATGFVIGVAIIGNHVFTSHQIIGWVVMVVGILQPANALIRPHKHEGQVSLRRWVWFLFHSMLGRIACILAFTNIFLGLLIIQGPVTWLYVFFLWVGLLAFVIFVLEGKKRLYRGKMSQVSSGPREGIPSHSPVSEPEVETEHDMQPSTTPQRMAELRSPVLGKQRRSSQNQV